MVRTASEEPYDGEVGCSRSSQAGLTETTSRVEESAYGQLRAPLGGRVGRKKGAQGRSSTGRQHEGSAGTEEEGGVRCGSRQCVGPAGSPQELTRTLSVSTFSEVMLVGECVREMDRVGCFGFLSQRASLMTVVTQVRKQGRDHLRCHSSMAR